MKALLEKEGYTHIRQLADGRWVGIMRFLFTWAIVVNLDKYGYTGRYCYEDFSEAVGALNEWDGNGDPGGPWIKYKGAPFERSRVEEQP